MIELILLLAFGLLLFAGACAVWVKLTSMISNGYWAAYKRNVNKKYPL